MTDEPDKAGIVKQSVTAALLAALLPLSALALLAGCKLPAQKVGFLRADDYGVQFIQWTQEGRQIKGTIDISKKKPNNEIETIPGIFDGVLEGENVSITAKSSGILQGGGKEPEEKITGMLRGNTLTLFLADRSEPKEFRQATPAEHAEAVRKLQTRAKLNKGAY